MVDEQAITCTKGVVTFHRQEEPADLRGYRGYCGSDRVENEPVGGDEGMNHGNHANHANHDNHSNHANRDSALPSHRSPQEWEEFIL
jgi:hypothetical protein